MAASTSTTFGHSDPSWRVELALPSHSISPAMIAAGDILYARRRGGYQQLTALAGDTWRHVGIVATIAGFPWLIDMGQGGYGARPITTVLKAYDSVAIQRLIPCGNYCDYKLLNNVALQMNFPKDFYHRRELATIGLNSILRLRSFTKRSAFRGAERRLRSSLQNRTNLDDRAVCTTPVARGLAQLCELHDINLDSLGEKETGPHPSVSQEENTMFAMPDDIWRALQKTTAPYWIKKDGQQSSVDIDLTVSSREEVPA